MPNPPEAQTGTERRKRIAVTRTTGVLTEVMAASVGSALKGEYDFILEQKKIKSRGPTG
jgi:hypothetical protein